MVAAVCAWLGVCVVVGGMRGCGGCAWLQGGVHDCGGHAWLQGACMVVGGMRGGGWEGIVRGIQRDTVNERAVRILLECILVLSLIMSIYHLMHSCAKCHNV